MRLLYSLLIVLLAPVAFIRSAVARLRDRTYRANLLERFGWGPTSAAPGLWMHAVSLGRGIRGRRLLRALRARHPDIPFVLTTATPTGRARATALFGGDIDIRFLPYDTPGSVRRFLTRIRPRLAIIMETELWPNLLHECGRRGIPVVSQVHVSARSLRCGTGVSAACSAARLRNML